VTFPSMPGRLRRLRGFAQLTGRSEAWQGRGLAGSTQVIGAPRPIGAARRAARGAGGIGEGDRRRGRAGIDRTAMPGGGAGAGAAVSWASPGPRSRSRSLEAAEAAVLKPQSRGRRLVASKSSLKEDRRLAQFAHIAGWRGLRAPGLEGRPARRSKRRADGRNAHFPQPTR
jgi:hypothetical protein